MSSFFNHFSRFEKLILMVIFAIFCHNLFLDIMIVDAAQYAGMSAEMAKTNSFLQVKECGGDYLDKPPLLFWLSSCSIKLFGVSNFAYKLPSFLILLLSIYAVFRFSLLYYSVQVAKNAALILASCQAYFLITNDVRTDAILTGMVITASWLVSAYFQNRKLKYLIFGAFFIGLGMLAKGPIALIAVLFPIGINLMYQNKWKDVFNWRWIFVIFVIAIALLPMCYGLYIQFDAQPNKVTYGKVGQSGLYFYFWLQSFGRITGENSWNNGLPWHYFLGSSLWDFFPWILPLYFAVFFQIKKIFSDKKKVVEITSLVGFMSLFVMMSLSKYKLQHYIFVSFPYAAVLGALYFSEIKTFVWHRWKTVFMVLSVLILVLFLVYQIFFFTDFKLWLFVCFIMQIFGLCYFYKQKVNSVFQLLGLVLTLNIFLSFVFYPKLLTFQADSMAGKWAFDNIKNQEIVTFENASNSFNFYTKNPFTKIVTNETLENQKSDFWVFMDNQQYQKFQSIISKKYIVAETKVFDDFAVTRLSLPFLLQSTRKQQLEKKYLIKIHPIQPKSS